MRHGSLFSGIGGFDLAAEWMGWENVFHCEWNDFGKRVLKYYFPNAISYDDITKTDFTIHRGKIDILTGGFPCQPFSLSGKRKGKEDERHLFPEMLRAIKEIRPRWIVCENVFGFVNIAGGLVFHEVQTYLETEGYEVFSYVLAASAINAPHRRDRIFIIAYSNNSSTEYTIQARRNVLTGEDDKRSITNTNNNGCDKYDFEYEEFSDIRRINAFDDINKMSCKRTTTDTNVIGLRRQGNWIEESIFIGKTNQRNNWQTFPTVSPICNGDDGISDRLDSITFPKWRKQSIMAAGNAVVPQLVYTIFKTIEAYEQRTNSTTL